jgi:hypothetical protein
MDRIQPDLNWYTEISASKNLAPRCPFASVYRCPRYYQSVALLGEVGVTTRIEPEEDKRLLDQWKRSDLWPVVAEQATSVMGAPNEPHHFSKFCPEVSFDTFGWFASHLSYHADEIDQDAAHTRLADEGASRRDWHWLWAVVTPMHYADCPVYSPLLSGVNETKGRYPIGFHTTT